MSVSLGAFPWTLAHRNGGYRARACGRQREDGLWEGWIEFDPEGKTGSSAASVTIRSSRETTQPNLRDLEYRSRGLTKVFLEGALARALTPVTRRTATAVPPKFDGPAPSPPATAGGEPDAILDPYSVYAKAPHILAQELRAFESGHLRQLIRAYGLADERRRDVEAWSREELADFIVRRVAETAE